MPSADSGKLEDQRLQLLRFIELRRPQGSLRNRVTVVFDGQPDMGTNSRPGAVSVIFSDGQSADDVIKGMVARAAGAKSIVVVTDDRDIQFAVKANGAKVLGVMEFLSAAKNPGTRPAGGPGKKAAPAGARVSRTEASKINAELEQAWLKAGKNQARKDK